MGRACEARQTIGCWMPGDDDNSPEEHLEDRDTPFTAGEVRKLLGLLANQRHATFAELLNAVQQGIAQEREAARRELAVLCQKCLMPDAHTLGQIMRYETHLARMFHRDLHELERMRALRNWQPVAEPIVMDVDMSGTTALPDGSPLLRRLKRRFYRTNSPVCVRTFWRAARGRGRIREWAATACRPPTRRNAVGRDHLPAKWLRNPNDAESGTFPFESFAHFAVETLTFTIYSLQPTNRPQKCLILSNYV